MRTKITAAIAALSILAALALPATATYRDDRHAAHEAAELMRRLGYSDDNPVTQAAIAWWWESHDAEFTETDEPVEAAELEAPAEYVTQAQKDEYRHASYVWQRLKEAGFSDPVAAGILGNMMAECGGQTLALQPYLYTGGYYGLCMWYIQYTPQIAGQDVIGQMDVLLDTMRHNMEYFGGDWDYFVEIDNTYDAAWYFANYYERGVWSDVRADNAQTALAYFSA